MRQRIKVAAKGALRRIGVKVNRQVSELGRRELGGAVDYAAWLTDGILATTGWIQMDPGGALSARATIDGRTVPLKVHYTSFSRPDVSTAEGGKVLIIQPLNAELLRQPNGHLFLITERGTLKIAFIALTKALTDLPNALASGLGWLDNKSRAGILNFIATALADSRENIDSFQANTRLLAARDALRAELRAEGRLPRLHVDALLAIDETSLYLRGWMQDPEAKITQLEVISPEGHRAAVQDRLLRHRRADVEKVYGSSSNTRPIGFAGHIEIAQGSRLSSGWKVEMQNAAGEMTQFLAPTVVRDLISVRDSVLQDLALEPPFSDALIRNCIFPLLSKLQERHNRMTTAEDVYDYGKLNSSPEVSIIVPLFRRIDFLEQQMAQFCHDPEINQCEIVYLLDSPEMAQELTEFALQIFRLYRIPFRVVVLNQNAGFAGVNNVGSSLARGKLLLLLNSDVLPDKAGWLGKMTGFYNSMPKIGALGPKLLYEDDSLQHAGLYFNRPYGSMVWGNQHYFKGLHRRFPAANVTRQLPAVTAACLMIDRNLYKQMNGLRGIYIQGDYEDSDLCLRLLEAGYENWYLPEVELYHLEGQSYPSAERRMASRYNAWVHTHLWNEQIESIMARYQKMDHYDLVQRLSVS